MFSLHWRAQHIITNPVFTPIGLICLIGLILSGCSTLPQRSITTSLSSMQYAQATDATDHLVPPLQSSTSVTTQDQVDTAHNSNQISHSDRPSPSRSDTQSLSLSGSSSISTKSSSAAQQQLSQSAVQSDLQQRFKTAAQTHPGLTGFNVLVDPNDALTTRLQLIEHAKHSIDLQYYIWDNDHVGALALEAILRAADRGVKVRLLIDDNNSAGLQYAYRAMAEHANVQVRLFNPYRFRKLRALDLILNGNRINRRMHNKTFTIDGQVTLIGGRNMSNQYYNIGDSFQFSDMDVVLVGQVVQDIAQSFEEYWQHDYAYPVQDLIPTTRHLSYPHLRSQLVDNWQDSEVQYFFDRYRAPKAAARWFRENMPLQWVKAYVVKDSAEKIRKDTPDTERLNFQLRHLIQNPTQYVDLVSAYFVPTQRNVDLLAEMVKKGVQVRVLTNSFKANDVAIMHAFYAKYRRPLLQSGVQLYEFKPVLPLTLTRKARVKLFGKLKFDRQNYSRSSLHAKFMASDDAQVFIGSFNFDPRSEFLNTEIGVVLDSPALARLIHRDMTNDLPKYAYQLGLDQRQRLTWRQSHQSTNEVTTREPQMKRWQKWALTLLSWLPIEHYM